MAIQIPHKHERGTDNLSGSASMAAIKAQKSGHLGQVYGKDCHSIALKFEINY